MRITRMTIGARNYYSVNSLNISRQALETIGEEIFTPQVWR